MGDHTPAEQGEIRADLEAMYRAGKIRLPERARDLSTVAREMSTVIGTVNARAAQMGDWPVLQDLLDMSADCQNGVVRSVTTANHLAEAVIAQADDFRARDEYAQSVFEGFGADLRGDPAPLPTVPPPVDRDDVVEPGAPGHDPNPDVQDPDEELDDRNDLLDVYQNFGDE